MDYQALEAAFAAMGFTRASPHNVLLRLLSGTQKAPVPAAAEPDSLLGDGQTPQAPDGATLRTTEDLVGAAVMWLPAYRRSRAEAVERYVDGLGEDRRFVPASAPTLAPDALWSVPPGPSLELLGQWHWGIATAERVLRWWGRALVDYASTVHPNDLAAPFAAIDTGQRQIAQLRRELEEQMGDVQGLITGDRIARLNAYYTAKSPGGDLSRDARILQIVSETARVITDQLGTTSATVLIDYTLALEVISAALAWESSSEGDQLRFRYRQITPAAKSLIDPGDAATKPEWLERKLYGQRWWHFGAFLSEDSRKADWLWGRLDGASALCDYLLTSTDADAAGRLREELGKAILEAEDSSAEKLCDAAQTAVDQKPTDLLWWMTMEQRQETFQGLWRNLGRLEGPKKPSLSTLSPMSVLRAAIDPLWSAEELPEGTSLKGRMLAHGIRAYTKFPRWWAARQIKNKLRI